MRKSLFGAIAFAAMFVGSAAHAATLTVYKSPSCGCCAKWVEHVEKHGFTVQVVPTAENVARTAHALLRAPLLAEGAELRRIRVRETRNNTFDCGDLG